VTDPILPPLPAIGSAKIEVLGAVPGSAKWDEALWDNAAWALFDWQDVTPQSMNAQVSWGADDPAGVLTVAAAGSWSIRTYDPDRLLDPSNGGSVHAQAIKPGKPIRLSYINETNERRVVRQGLIDEVDYDLISRQGTLRGTDNIQLLVGAKLLAGQNLDPNVPSTLRARAAYLINKAGIGKLVPVEGQGADYSSQVREHNPLGYWKLDDADLATMADSSGSLNNGSFVGAVTLRQPPLISGGFSALFAGGHGIIPTALVVPNWTFETWLLVSALPAASGIIVDRNSGTAPCIWLRNDGAICVSAGSPTGTLTASSPPGAITVDVPHHVIVTRQGSAIRVIVDAVDATVVGPVVAFSGAVASFRIGNTFAGRLDEVAVYPDVFSVDTALSHYNYGISLVGSVDPPVGPIDDREATVWTHILSAAYDALYAVWMDRLGTLRFRSFGDPRDIGFDVGGETGIAIDTMKSNGSLQSVFTHIIAYDVTAPTVAVAALDIGKIGIYGDILLRREAPVPNAQVWADSVLADRAGSGLQYFPGTLRPQTEDQLEQILALGMIDIASLHVDSVEPTIDVAARVLGASLEANTDSGWSAHIISYIPANEWAEAETPPITPPPIIPPPNTVKVTRTYACTKDARLAHSSSLDAGNGTDVNLPIGYISPYRNRAVMGFAAIPWGGVVSVDKAELIVTIGQNSCGAFGSEPKVKVERLTQSFSEGSYNSTCGFGTSNAVKYPGPSVTSSGAVSSGVPKGTGTQKSIDITAIVRAWFSGQSQHGLRIISAGEDSSKWTTCFYSRHHGTAGNRPSLKLTLTVNA
jgi:hypothetical protein